MPASEDSLSLLEELRHKYGVDESDPLLGPSIIVPNNEWKHGWTQLLSQAGVKTFLGDQYGRVAWIVPLRGKPEPRSLTYLLTSETEISGSRVGETNEEPPAARGCITGRLWTQDEDSMLIAMLNQGKEASDIARDLASKLDRTEEAVKGRVRKLKRRLSVGPEPMPTHEKPVEASPERRGEPRSEPGEGDIRCLLESALLLAENPKHKPALKLVLEACLRAVTPPPEKTPS
jgi:hypothetical protein